jgi:hypothetical protein
MKGYQILLLTLIVSIVSVFAGYQMHALQKKNDRVISIPPLSPQSTTSISITEPYIAKPEWNLIYTPVFSVQYPLTMASLVFTSYDSPDSRILNRQSESSKTIKAPDNTIALSLDKEELLEAQSQCAHQNKNRVYIGKEDWDKEFYSTEEKPEREDFFNPDSAFRRNLPTRGGGGGISKKSYSNAVINNAYGLRIETVWTNTIECSEGTVVDYVFLLPGLPDEVLKVSYFTKQSGDELIPEEILSTLQLRTSY